MDFSSIRSTANNTRGEKEESKDKLPSGDSVFDKSIVTSQGKYSPRHYDITPNYKGIDQMGHLNKIGQDRGHNTSNYF